MFTGPVGPVEVFLYWPEAVLGNFYWPGAIGSPLASSPELGNPLLIQINTVSTNPFTSPRFLTIDPNVKVNEILFRTPFF